MDYKLLAGIAGVTTFLLFVVMIYNRLVRLRLATRGAWADTDVYLKKRYDLVPNLVETIKGYAGYENETLVKITELRSVALRADSPAAKAKADNMLTQALKSVFAVAEAYPDLKADKHFLELMNTLKGLDDSVEFARRYYNSAVQAYNASTEVFPDSIIASAFNFKPAEFFELAEASPAREPVSVSFKK